MKVILKQDVKGLGAAGDVVEVAEGYGRNFLIPRGLAAEATAGNLNLLRQQRQKAETQARRALDEARAAAAKLDGCTVTVQARAGDAQRPVQAQARAGEGGRLFGSVTSQDVADALARSPGVRIDKRRIGMEPVKALGAYPATVRLHPQVTARITVHVVAPDTAKR